MAQDPQEDELKAWTTRLPKEIQKNLRALAAYKGRNIQEVHAEILQMYFDAIGPIPVRNPALDNPWADSKKKKPPK